MRMVSSRQVVRLESLETPACQCAQFCDQRLIDTLEIETRFPLHVFFQFRRNRLKQFRNHIHGHEIETDVVLLGLHRTKEQDAFVLRAEGTVQGLVVRIVMGKGQLFGIGFQQGSQARKDGLEV